LFFGFAVAETMAECLYVFLRLRMQLLFTTNVFTLIFCNVNFIYYPSIF
jgi:hypothetical protein